MDEIIVETENKVTELEVAGDTSRSTNTSKLDGRESDLENKLGIY